MPEISGQGQKILLESKVIIYGENVKDVSPLIYYLAASGVGHIVCYFEDDNEYETLFYNIKDLNKDISIVQIDKNDLLENNDMFYSNLIRIFLGSIKFINAIINMINFKNARKFIPTIITLINDWKGTLQTFDNFDKFNDFVNIITNKYTSIEPKYNEFGAQNSIGKIISTSIMGALCSIEIIKECLNFKKTNTSLLYFDVFSMEFSKAEQNYAYSIIDNLLCNNYNDLVSMDNTEEKLSEHKILVVGTGGLGSPAALALLMAGIGTIGLVDYDKVEISNLNRQILHSTSRIGIPKVDSAKAFLKNINPNTNIITYSVELNKDNAMKIINTYDIVIDGVDNLPTRYLLNDTCFFMKKPMLEAGVLRFSGLNTTIIPEDGHCFRCAFPNMSMLDSTPSCSESGVLGPVPGVMGFIEAAEAIKLIIGKGKVLKNELLYFDAFDLEFTLVEINKNPLCPLCGNQPKIAELQEYKIICEKKKN
ncbi:HesA/MoeB/ThiF family protein [Candidatus Clostridium radicumherbarum]|uniref:ThiF family adenylyltransferase n=1 Tax=Candidatus Clostridium radicumherbarum TaxID=3381662 RepID=A0ABW8TSB2_9CLOT